MAWGRCLEYQITTIRFASDGNDLAMNMKNELLNSALFFTFLSLFYTCFCAGSESFLNKGYKEPRHSNISIMLLKMAIFWPV